jgi:hypothetical protein
MKQTFNEIEVLYSQNFKRMNLKLTCKQMTIIVNRIIKTNIKHIKFKNNHCIPMASFNRITNKILNIFKHSIHQITIAW